jgi:hypothetical protein
MTPERKSPPNPDNAQQQRIRETRMGVVPTGQRVDDLLCYPFVVRQRSERLAAM